MLLTEMKNRCPVACQLISDGPHTITQDTQDVRTTESTAHTTMLKVSRRSCQRALTLNTPPRRPTLMDVQAQGPKDWNAKFRGVCPVSCFQSFHVLVASDSTTHMHFLPHSSPILSTPRSAPRHVLLKIKIKRFQPVLRSHKCVNPTVTSVIRGDQRTKASDKQDSATFPPCRSSCQRITLFFSSHSTNLSAHKGGGKLPRRRLSSSLLKTASPLLSHLRLRGLLWSGVRIFNHVSNFTTLPCTAPPCVDERLIS